MKGIVMNGFSVNGFSVNGNSELENDLLTLENAYNEQLTNGMIEPMNGILSFASNIVKGVVNVSKKVFTAAKNVVQKIKDKRAAKKAIEKGVSPTPKEVQAYNEIEQVVGQQAKKGRVSPAKIALIGGGVAIVGISIWALTSKKKRR